MRYKIVGFGFAILMMALVPMPNPVDTHTHPNLMDRNEIKVGVYEKLFLVIAVQVLGCIAIFWKFGRGVESIAGQFVATGVRFEDHSERIDAQELERVALAKEVRMLRIICTHLGTLIGDATGPIQTKQLPRRRYT